MHETLCVQALAEEVPSAVALAPFIVVIVWDVIVWDVIVLADVVPLVLVVIVLGARMSVALVALHTSPVSALAAMHLKHLVEAIHLERWQHDMAM